MVNGRIDLIRRTDTIGGLCCRLQIDRACATRRRDAHAAHVYALGYRELSGEPADLIEIHNLDKSAPPIREVVDPELERATRGRGRGCRRSAA